jgi:hypothetical protein
MLKMNEIVKNKYVFVCLVFIFLMGVFVRGWKLGEIPVGVHQDETNLSGQSLFGLRLYCLRLM